MAAWTVCPRCGGTEKKTNGACRACDLRHKQEKYLASRGGRYVRNRASPWSCLRCGGTEKASNGTCKHCKNKKGRELYHSSSETRARILANSSLSQKLHRAERNAYREAWRKKKRAANVQLAREQERIRRQRLDPGKLEAKQKRFKANNPDYWRQWGANHQEQRRDAYRRRRARKQNAPGTHTTEQAVARKEYYGGICWICQACPATAMDHVFCLCNGGSDWAANLRPVCGSCNSAKAGWERRQKRSLHDILAWVEQYRRRKSKQAA